MIPTAANSDYPKFVPDQVLTSDNLNDLFGYLDEQGRMTRTNLSGIGIVCGLQVKTAADGSSITITKGVGVTSSGYLVSVPEVTYTKRTTAIFDAVKCEYYSKFVNIAAKTQKFDLWELKQEAESEGTTAINNSFLSTGEKVVLLFVELLEENNKNCDPNSCDDKGVKVTVNFKPLLVEKANVESLLAGTGAVSPWINLPDISMRRFNVLATPINECVNIFDSYRKILSPAFLTKTQNALTQAYNALQPALAADFPTNPFAELADDFKFVHDSTIGADQLIAIQYYYDLFSDLLQAYNEVKEKGTEVIGMCCPDDVFPRHLLLDLAKPDASLQQSNYRHYFIPSPILTNEANTISQLQALFKKLVLLAQKFAVPSMAIPQGSKTVDPNIRITPSLLADVPFSKKSIPYYYNITNATDALLKNWDYKKLKEGKSDRNLSYHATKYNTTDEEIRKPLLYDLEPYNFLRIEGHIGKNYVHVVKNILALRDNNRLPFEVVALNADISSITAFLKNLGKMMTSGSTAAQATLESLMGGSCHFNDLELMYDSIMTELTTKLSSEMKFFYDIVRDKARGELKMPPPATDVPQALLLQKTDSAFRFTVNTIGHDFELFYATIKNQPFISFAAFFQSFGQQGNTDAFDFAFKAIIYYMEMLYRIITTSLSSFNFFDFYIRYYTLLMVVKAIKFWNKLDSARFPLKEEENDHLDAILAIAAEGRITLLYLEFIRRILTVKVMQQAGYYFKSNPGVQHKAGVPFGGTFIVVYHEKDQELDEEEEATTFAAVAVTNNAANNQAAANIAGGNAKAAEAVAGAQVMQAGTTSEHIESMTAGIQENVRFSAKKITDGIEKTFKISSAKRQQQNIAGASKENAVTASASASASKSTKDAVMTYLAEAAAYLKNREDNELDEAIEDFNNGIVIADFYLPYLCCSDCPPIKMVIGVEPEKKPNESPVADAGPDAETDLIFNPSAGVGIATVKLNGTNSKDPEGSALTFLWKEKSGNASVTIQGDTLAEPTITLKAAGDFTFELTVTDNAGKTDTDEVVIKVNEPEPANLEITDKAGPYCNVKSGGKIRLTATPAGGTFSSAPAGVAVQTDGNGFFFMPESLTAGTYLIKYAFADGRNDSVSFDISQAFTVTFAKPVAREIAGTAFVDITFRVTNIPGATYQWDFTIDGGAPQSRQTTVNSIIIRVNRQQQLIQLAVSVAASPCSAQTEREFRIQSIIG